MDTLRRHYPEYLMEAAGLGIFMICACVVTTLLEHPASPLRQAISDSLLRRFSIGVAMGLTASTIVYSPWGKQSGAHLNPAFTLTFFRLGKVKSWDAFFYILAQFIGGLIGLVLAALILKDALAHPTINYLVTKPGTSGEVVAFFAELMLSFGMMLMVLFVSNSRKLNKYTGLFAGGLIAIYITVEAPLSGMSMNPARSLASAIPAQVATGLWIYFTAPLLGMFFAAEVYVRLMGKKAVKCAKLHHDNNFRCIFRCNYRRSVSVDGRWDLSDKLPSP
ncbi:MIP/aquaporin family protein [Aerosakkonemataceae cyanobacterium BLCC-F50]|uniref:MIP/aquaporin family protein n=1 Tax=Floridaenema flaviceps BLCC-F50 TaxID=3153642 RepID=A0ABV4XV86_9CYAN